MDTLTADTMEFVICLSDGQVNMKALCEQFIRGTVTCLMGIGKNVGTVSLSGDILAYISILWASKCEGTLWTLLWGHTGVCPVPDGKR